jgi:prepilin-type N-terminal cleavage/methylation domain-containing protein
MLKTKLKDQNSRTISASQRGFTIIEVLIVLAIAGLILLIVFLAVPALQRNARNTAIKNDASAVAGGVSEFESNNDGAAVTGISGTGTVAISGATGTTTPTNAKVQGNTVVTKVTTVPGAGSPAPGTISVFTGKTCAGATSTRAVAIYYSIENSSNTPQQKCLDT